MRMVTDTRAAEPTQDESNMAGHVKDVARRDRSFFVVKDWEKNRL